MAGFGGLCGAFGGLIGPARLIRLGAPDQFAGQGAGGISGEEIAPAIAEIQVIGPGGEVNHQIGLRWEDQVGEDHVAVATGIVIRDGEVVKVEGLIRAVEELDPLGTGSAG